MENFVINDIKNNLHKIDWLLEYLPLNRNSSQFFYDCYTVYHDILSIDVNTFNLNFLKFINSYLNNILEDFINSLEKADKQTRVVNFGLFLKRLNENNIFIRDYMVSFRNCVFKNFFEDMSYSSRSLQLYRLNFDDVEFSRVSKLFCSVENYVNKDFINIVKLKKFDHVIVLNKTDGVFYVKDDKIVDIKYTSGWVNIPIYRLLLNKLVNFIIYNKITIQDLNKSLYDILEHTANEHMFGYSDCPISKEFTPTDIVPFSVKGLFLANIMSKFAMLINRI